MVFMSINAFKNKIFNNIVIMPTTSVSSWNNAKFSFLSGKIRVIAGGPVYDKNVPRYVRHCIGIIPIVFEENSEPKEICDTIDSGVWCGHVSQHFGHMISDYSMRIAVSAAKHPDKFLLFSLSERMDLNSIPPFFWQIVSNFGAKKENVRFINKPTLVKEMIVYPQAERRYDGKPSKSYLKLIDSLHPPVEKRYGAIYFSRTNYLMGGIAGERYLEEVMKDLGVLVIRPEEYSLEMQINFCRQAEKLIFAEGSAVHLLQLVGTGIGDVVVLTRRTLMMAYGFFCRSVILPRAKSLSYISSIEYVLYCHPEIAHNNGLTILNISDSFFKKFKRLGFDLESVWDQKKYENVRNDDILKWINILPSHVWGNSSLYKKLKVIRELSAEVSSAIADNKCIYDNWIHIQKLGIFDEDYYLACNPDVKAAGVKALAHYKKFGWKEGRNPSVYFDSKFYMSQFVNGYNESLDPVSHYFLKGWKNNLNPNPNFNVEYYLNRYQDVKLKNLEPLQHYVEYGQILGYVTSE
ncbi:MAG: glycosyltransferase family 61 protein [Rheinheimera sp.]|nr:MAG: glycosyltransferase family 61 protein [Rheinheimera sp.]